MLGITAHFRRQDGKPELPTLNYKWKGFFYNGGRLSEPNLLDLLNAEGDLCDAFIWESTPQGNDYWSDLYDEHNDSHTTLPEEACEYIQYLIEEHT